MAQLVTHSGVPDDPAVVARWDALVAADPLGSFFHTAAYLSLWTEVLGTRATVHVHEVVEDGTTIGIVPVALQREGSPTGPLEVVRFLGGTSVTDYIGPVALPEHRQTVAEAYLDRLVTDADWDEFVIGGVVVDSGWDEHWLRAGSAHGLTTLGAVDDDVCPRVDVSGGYGAYLDRLPSKLRHEQRRKVRKLVREAGDIAVVEVPAAGMDEALDRFFQMNVEMGDDKGRFFANDEMRSWFRALADRFVEPGVFRLHELHVGGIPAAACVSLVHDGEWGLYNSAFDGSLAALAPGMVLVGELVQDAADSGCDTFDLLRGDEAYKYRFGAQDRAMVTASFQRG